MSSTDSSFNCTVCGNAHDLKDITEITKNLPKRNAYYLVRHGTALHNELGIVNGIISKSFDYPLTVRGVEEVQRTAESLKDKGITHVYSSPFKRTEETARIIAQKVGREVITDPRLSEINFGDMEGRDENDVVAYTPSLSERFVKRKPNGENLQDVARRVLSFMNETDSKLEDKTICVVSHEDPLRALQWLTNCGTSACMNSIPPFLRGSMCELEFRALPVTADEDIDFKKLFEIAGNPPCLDRN